MKKSEEMFDEMCKDPRFQDLMGAMKYSEMCHDAGGRKVIAISLSVWLRIARESNYLRKAGISIAFKCDMYPMLHLGKLGGV